MGRRSFQRGAAAVVVAGLLACASAGAAELVTAEEANRPAAPHIETRGGITRGPSIKVVSPPSDGTLKAPLDMKISFQPHGGSKIDASSVKVTYLKKPAVDLTPRLKAAISESGIDAPAVVMPEGTHTLKVDVTDADGRTKSNVVSFTVVK